MIDLSKRNFGVEMTRSFLKSEELLRRARLTIPLGAQTFSKSFTQFPVGASPFFLERGLGSRVWDVDGNEFVDFISSLSSIILGYCDSDVKTAVADQLNIGTIMSLSHRLEAEVAEIICRMVPCAEMVRFGKNGSDATAGAIRLARAYTNRDHVAVCGYHGWQDWYIGSTARNRGVPDDVRQLTHAFKYNDIDSLRSLITNGPHKFAAIILEPMNVNWPERNFLSLVKKEAESHGALLIFDETITGFRFSNGGAQELFGVTPDLACFGKAIANGFPLSAIAGRRDVMNLMEEVFFSFTFGGELLSLAAAKCVLTKLANHPILQEIHSTGLLLMRKLEHLINKEGLHDIFSVTGHPSWSFLNINSENVALSYNIKTVILQELHQRGVLCLGAHNISRAHTPEDIEILISAYAEILPRVKSHANAGNVEDLLRCVSLQPLFKVR